MNFKEFKKLKIQYNQCNIEEFKEGKALKVKDNRTILNNENVYEVYPIASDSKRVYVICPYCNEIHIHGLNKETIPGYRMPFCESHVKNKSYYVKAK